MNNILSLGELLRKKSFIILYVRGLGVTILALGYMREKLVGRELQIIQKTALFGTDVVRAYGNTEFPYQGRRKVAYAVRCNDQRESFGLLDDQYVLSDVGGAVFILKLYQLLG